MSGGTGSTLVLRPHGLTAITFDLDADSMAAGSYVVDLNTFRLGEEGREVMEYAQRTGAEGGDLVGVQNPLVPITFEAVAVDDSRAGMLEMVHDLRVALQAGGWLEYKPEDLPVGASASYYAYLPSAPGGLKSKRRNRWDGPSVNEGGTFVYRVECLVGLMTRPFLVTDPDDPVMALAETTIENRDDATGDNFITIPAAVLDGDSRALLQIMMRNMEKGFYDDVLNVYVFPRVHGLANHRIVFEPGTVVVGATEWATIADAGRASGDSYQRLTPTSDDLVYRLQFQVTDWTDFVGRQLLMIACRDNGGTEGDFEVRGGWSLGVGDVKDPTPWRSTRGEWLGEWQLFSLGEMEFPGTQTVEVEEAYTDPYYELEVFRNSGGTGTFEVDFFVAGPVDLRPLYVDCSEELFLHDDWLLLSNLEYPTQVAHLISCTLPCLEFDGAISEVDCGSDAAIDDLWGTGVGTQDFTVECWANPDGPGEGQAGKFFVKGDGNPPGWYFGFDRPAAQDQLQFRVYSGGAQDPLATMDWGGSDGLPHHYAAVFRAGLAPRMFVDGQEVTYVVQLAGIGNLQTDVAVDLFLGNNTAQSMTFDGRIGWCRVSDNIRYAANFTPPVRCTLPAIDGNTVAQWIGVEGMGTVIENQEGTAALDGTQTDCEFVCDCGWKLTAPVKPLGLLPLANCGKEATDGYRLYFLWERRDGTLVVDDDFSGYDANWQEISDCDVPWVGSGNTLARVEGAQAQAANILAILTRTVGPIDYSGWAGTDYFCCVMREQLVGPVANDFEFHDGAGIYRRTATVQAVWSVIRERKTDFVIDAGAPNWNSIDDAVLDRTGHEGVLGEWDNWRWSKKDPASAQPNDFGAAWNYFLAAAPWFVYTDAATRCAGNPTPVDATALGSETGAAEQLLLSNMANSRNIKYKARVYAFQNTELTDSELGLAARCSDGTSGSEDCYYLSISEDADTLTLYKYVAGAPTALATVGFTVAAATWYWLGIECLEETITCYAHATEANLWDNALIEVTDTSQATGQCGFMVKEGMGRFDDAEVWAEDDRYNPQDEMNVEVKALLRGVYPHYE